MLDISEGRIGEGWIEFTMRPQGYMLNLAGTVHGGVRIADLSLRRARDFIARDRIRSSTRAGALTSRSS